MKSVIMRITLLSVVLHFFFSLPGYSATEQRTALVIGNGAYSSGPLKNPVNDATDLAAALKQSGFTVTLKKNANLQEMVESIEDFGNSLKRGGVGLFYYAGHGVQVNSVNYLLPVNARINKESDVRFQALDAGRILAEMENANNGLNIVILDACRDNPFGKSFRSVSRGLAIVANAPSGTFISYSTGAGQVARDGDGRNSPYTKALLENIAKQGLTINDVFMNVRTKVKKETGQVPWELSSLEGRFYFNVRAGGSEEIKRLDDERQTIAQERELLEKQRALDEEREKLETLKREQVKQAPPVVQKKEVAIVSPPTVTGPRETRRDERFIAYDNGTVLDTKTNLMWAANDNGRDINWTNAKSYSENYRGGGYSDWRMPTLDELEGLYDVGKTYKSECGYDVHLTEFIRLSCVWPWASKRGRSAAAFPFTDGKRNWSREMDEGYYRAIPVRSGEKAALEQERQELAREKQEMERQKALDNEREQLAAVRRKVEAERQQVTAQRPLASSGAGKMDKESSYAAAYGLFKEGKYEKSRESFENFHKQFPNTELSDNAQFWVGECYYFEKKYEKAIVEYDKVTKNFPEGNKVPYALLRQGLSFLKLGDKVSAKLLLQRVANDFPNTNQSRIARVKLLEVSDLPAIDNKSTSISSLKETVREGRFIAYDNGTVLDTKTNLIWASKDNGSDINWANAKSYCENYRGGGFTDWRMPTQDELVRLYDAGKSRAGACNTSYPIHVATELIDITCSSPWASETRGSDAAYFFFYNGKRIWHLQSNALLTRALPVRNAK